MRLVSYEGGAGVLEEDYIWPITCTVTEALSDVTSLPVGGEPVELRQVRLLPPIARPPKIICVGLNYYGHADEVGKAYPKEPVLFAKFANSLTGSGSTVAIPSIVSDADWEAELAVVIGRRGRQISEGAALKHVAGYMCANDMTARTLQHSAGQWTRGKAIDDFLPVGPWVTTEDEISDPQDLRIRCFLNEESVQDSSTADMIFSVAEIVSFISETITLDVGDIICTGTPAGVGLRMDPPRFLRPGDTSTVVIDGLGRLENRIG